MAPVISHLGWAGRSRPEPNIGIGDAVPHHCLIPMNLLHGIPLRALIPSLSRAGAVTICTAPFFAHPAISLHGVLRVNLWGPFLPLTFAP